MPGLCRKRDSKGTDKVERGGKDEMKIVYFRQAIFSNVLFSCVVVLLRAQGLFKVERIWGVVLEGDGLEMWIDIVRGGA